MLWLHEWIVYATWSSPESPFLVASFIDATFIGLLKQCILDALLEYLGSFLTFTGKEKTMLKDQYH